jgi:small-conductance mechanosensitive channel
VKLKEVTGNVSQSVESVSRAIYDYLPSILGAVLLLLVGWLLAYLLQLGARGLFERGLRRLGRNKTIRSKMQQSQIYQSLPQLGGRLVFWLVLLFFLAAAVEALGLTEVSSTIGYATAYIPRILAAVVILFAGFWLAELARGFSVRIAASADIRQGEVLGQTVRVLVLTLAAILAVEQLGIDSSVLVTLLVTVFAGLFGAAALAFGLGARDTVSNIIGSHYVQRNYKVGDRIRIGESEGVVIDINNTVVTLDTDSGRLMIPGQRFNTEDSVLLERTS